LFSISGSVCADVNRLAKQCFEGRALAMGGPQLELGVALGADLEEIVLPAIVKLEFRDHLLVASFQTLRQTKQRREHSNHPPIVALQLANPFV
jgi:hypothetical protein